MAQNIGGVVCTFLHARPGAVEPTTRVNLWQTPGYSGYGAYRTGAGDSPFAYEAVRIDTRELVLQWITDMHALKGQVVALEDDFAIVYSRALLTTMTQTVLPPRGVLVRGSMLVRGVVLEQ